MAELKDLMKIKETAEAKPKAAAKT
jgi:hypothetical protein